MMRKKTKTMIFLGVGAAAVGGIVYFFWKHPNWTGKVQNPIITETPAGATGANAIWGGFNVPAWGTLPGALNIAKGEPAPENPQTYWEKITDGLRVV